MNKKIVIGIIVVLVLCAIGGLILYFTSRDTLDSNTNTDNSVNESVPTPPENTGSNNTDNNDNPATSGRTLFIFLLKDIQKRLLIKWQKI